MIYCRCQDYGSTAAGRRLARRARWTKSSSSAVRCTAACDRAGALWPPRTAAATSAAKPTWSVKLTGCARVVAPVTYSCPSPRSTSCRRPVHAGLPSSWKSSTNASQVNRASCSYLFIICWQFTLIFFVTVCPCKKLHVHNCVDVKSVFTLF